VGELLKQFYEKGKLVAAICAAPTALKAHRIAINQGRRITCYPSLQHELLDAYTFVEESVAVDGNLITSRGPATAMPFALAIVKALCGEEISKNIASQLLYQ